MERSPTTLCAFPTPPPRAGASASSTITHSARSTLSDEMAPAPVAIGGTAPHRAPHAAATDDVIARFATHATLGLADAQVEELKARHGPNVLDEGRPVPWWRRLGRQFTDVVIWVLLGAAAVSVLMGDWTDALIILAIVVVNGLVGFYQEERAGRALQALRNLSSPHARVIRDGRLRLVPARDLVPGDRVELEAGDHIPADTRLIHATGFRVQEAALTGESAPVEKDHRAVHDESAAPAERTNVAHMGTVAAGGKAGGIVVATGMHTQLGQIAGMLARHVPEPTPLQRRLARLGRVLVLACLAIVALIFVLQLLRGSRPADVFVTAVSLAVAAIPEGMPAVVTIALALGFQRMARRNVLVRRLPAVETLGSVTVICSDKTGTLTRNEMTVREVHAGGERFDITGAGYAPEGQFLRDSSPVDPVHAPALLKALVIGARCNNARVEVCASGEWQVTGDPTEGALAVAAMKAEAGGGIGATGAADVPAVLLEIPFDSERKAMSVVVPRSPRGVVDGVVLYTKGAPEVVLVRCVSELRADGTTPPMTEQRRQAVLNASADMASRAMRVLGLAYREYPVAPDLTAGLDEQQLVFAGVVGMMDPPRAEAREAVRRCRSAGIKPVMITGDHPATALAVARELGLANGHDVALTGAELDHLPDDALAGRVDRLSVYARVTPAHKLRIVRAWRARGDVVAMTGDGVNDAPAVQEADIGIAMGVAGTDVTRGASDMVLTDDNFASIVAAVEEGRGIFDNIRKFVHYLLASNASELLLVLFAALAGWPVPLLAIHILWINLVTDSLPALALGTEAPEPGAMSRPPRPPGAPVIGARGGLLIVAHGLLIAAVGAVAFAWTYDGDPARLAAARSAAFCVIVFAQLLYAFTCRSLTRPLHRLGFASNPRLLAAVVVASLLQLGVMLTPAAAAAFELEIERGLTTLPLIAVLALLPAIVIELSKTLLSRGGRS